jgi:hypothetical protein
MHKVIVLLMLDAGLRISACSINAKNFDFKIETSQSNQPKKRGQNTCELFQYQTDFQAIGEYLKKMKFR